MTHFEYLAMAFGLFFTLAALRLIGGLPYALDAARRYWVHSAATLMILIAGTATFWNFWSLQDVSWTFLRFVLALLIPALLYFNAATLIPENPSSVGSWEEHYVQYRMRFFLGLVLWAVAASVSDIVNAGAPLVTPIRGFHGLVVAFGVTGAVFSSHKVHATMFLVLTAVGVVIMLILAGMPNWFTR